MDVSPFFLCVCVCLWHRELSGQKKFWHGRRRKLIKRLQTLFFIVRLFFLFIISWLLNCIGSVLQQEMTHFQTENPFLMEIFTFFPRKIRMLCQKKLTFFLSKNAISTQKFKYYLQIPWIEYYILSLLLTQIQCWILSNVQKKQRKRLFEILKQ